LSETVKELLESDSSERYAQMKRGTIFLTHSVVVSKQSVDLIFTPRTLFACKQ